MVRTLTANTTTAKNSAGEAPLNLLKIEFGGAVGTKWYADRDRGAADASAWNDAEGRVIDWGGIQKGLQAEGLNPISTISIVLRDDDKTLLGYLTSLTIPRTKATIYQSFDGLVGSDLAILASGILNSPSEWAEDAVDVTFTITDISTYYPQTIGHAADKDAFSDIWREHEDRVLPIVFGRVYRAPAVWATATPITYLAQPLRPATPSTFYVENGFQFPQWSGAATPTPVATPAGTPTPSPTPSEAELTIRVGAELMEGTFSGNVFTVTARGVALATGLTTTDDAGNDYRLIDSALGANADRYIGYRIKLTPTGMGAPQTRLITGYQPDSFQLLFNYPFQDGGGDWEVPTGHSYEIVTVASTHELSEPVCVHRDEGYTYIVNDAPSKAVLKVEAWSRHEVSVTDDGETDEYKYEGWTQVSDALFTVNRNDSATYASLGRAVTTITFFVPPVMIPDSGIVNNDIRVSIEGIDSLGDGTGTLIENPALIVKNLLENSDYGLGLDGSEIDATAFGTAQSSANFLKMGFVVEQERQAMEVIAEIAFQGRCALIWEEGLASIVFLTNSPGSSEATINEAHRVMDSLRVSHADFDGIVTEITARWTERGDERTYKRVDATAEAAVGRRARDLDLWCYAQREYVRYVSSFYLYRWKRLWDYASLATFLTHLELQRGDWATVNVTGLWASQLGFVESLDHTPGNGVSRLMDSIRFTLRLPRWGGCSTTCEDDCTAAACETGCEAYNCKTSSETAEDAPEEECETGCQTACKNICVTQCELYTQTGYYATPSASESAATPSLSAATPSGDEPTGSPEIPTPSVSEATLSDDEPTLSEVLETPSPGEPTDSGVEATTSPEEPSLSEEFETPSPEAPTLSADEPTLSEDEPTLSEDEPTLSEDEPTLSGDEPTLSDDEPTLSEDEPTLSEDEPTPAATPNTCCDTWDDCYGVVYPVAKCDEPDKGTVLRDCTGPCLPGENLCVFTERAESCYIDECDYATSTEVMYSLDPDNECEMP